MSTYFDFLGNKSLGNSFAACSTGSPNCFTYLAQSLRLNDLCNQVKGLGFSSTIKAVQVFVISAMASNALQVANRVHLFQKDVQSAMRRQHLSKIERCDNHTRLCNVR